MDRKHGGVPGEPAFGRLLSYFSGFLFFGLFSLSDLYLNGIGRIFDYVGILMIFLLPLIGGRKLRLNLISPVLLLILISPWMLFGLVSGEVLPFVAIVTGVLVFYSIFSGEFFSDANWIYRISGFTLAVNVSFLFLQMIHYYSSGVVIDFSALMGSIPSRGLNEGLGYFRPSGLFQEPNAYCTMIFSLLAMRLSISRKSTLIDFVGVLSLVLTQSLWGFGAALIVLWFLLGAKNFFKVSCFLTAFVVLFFVYSGMSIDGLAENSVTLYRILNIGDDPSRQARFGSGEGLSALGYIFGKGLDTSNFQDLAANGLAFLIYCFGLIGVFLIFVWLFFVERVRRLGVYIVAIFLFSTFPLFTYMYFWAWFGLFVRYSRVEKSLKLDFLKM